MKKYYQRCKKCLMISLRPIITFNKNSKNMSNLKTNKISIKL